MPVLPWRRPKPLLPAYPEEALARLSDAVADGGAPELAAWAATGRVGIQLLYDVKRGAVKEPWGRVDGRLLLDTVPAAFAEIAKRFPVDFLDVFADPRWDGDSDVLAGFGSIDDLRATAHLVSASRARSNSIRMWAAVGLPAHVSLETTDALLRLATDADWLVRQHALDGLHGAGDERAAAVLKTLPLTDRDRERADAAVRAIEERFRRGEPPPGPEAERAFLPSEIATMRYAFIAAGEDSPRMAIEGPSLLLVNAADRTAMTGTPIKTDVGVGVGFRATDPLVITIGSHFAVGEQQATAVRAMKDAASRCRLRIEWPRDVDLGAPQSSPPDIQ